MAWEPNRASKKPLYKQITEYVENNIANGAFPPEKQLPSERALAKGFEGKQEYSCRCL